MKNENWTGNTKAVYSTLGASNHSDKTRHPRAAATETDAQTQTNLHCRLIFQPVPCSSSENRHCRQS